MLLRVVDPERALFQVGAARGDRIEIIETATTSGLFQQCLMCDLRSPADIADVDWTRLIDRARREAYNIGRKWKIAARPAGDARHVLHAMLKPNKDVVELRQKLQ